MQNELGVNAVKECESRCGEGMRNGLGVNVVKECEMKSMRRRNEMQIRLMILSTPSSVIETIDKVLTIIDVAISYITKSTSQTRIVHQTKPYLIISEVNEAEVSRWRSISVKCRNPQLNLTVPK